MTDAPDHAAATAATTAMLWYPAQILTDDSHNGLERRIAARILAHSEGRDPIQYEERRKKPRSNPAKQTTDQRTAARIYTKLTMHSLSRAAGCLAPGSIVQQPTPEDLANLQDLHPPGEPAQPPPIDTAAPHITVDDLERVLGNLPNSSAPGLSGWTYEHVRSAASASTEARDAILHLINQVISGQFPQVTALLSTRLVPIRKPDGGIRPIAVQEVWGDPLASLLFSLTLQPALEAAQATADPADAALLAYADDCSIRGTGAPIIKAFTTLEEHAHPIGLRIGRAKSAATSIIDRDAAQNVADATGVPLRPHGVTCAGTPIGHTPYVKDYCNRRATTACAKIDRLLSLPLPAQDKFLLLRGSVQLALTHLVRVVAWDSVKDAVQRLQDRAMAAAREIMHHPQMPTVAEEQLRLPLRHGGFGLMDVTEHEADAAYLSSAALAHDAMCDGPPDFRPFAEGDVATGLQEKWTALRAAMPPEADWGPEELDNVFIATGLR
eukprot:jgi/Ulvmu1/3541/UM164_0007.1